MKWEKYRSKFLEQAQKRNLSKEKISFLLDYSENLYKNKFPIIFDVIHLSKLVGYEYSYIERATKHTHFFYRHYQIPKKNGHFRKISEPLPSLKDIQKWILLEILYKHEVSRYAKAYVKNRNLKSNAIYHQNKEAVLTIDIIDFFGSIKGEDVYILFKNIGYNAEVSNILTKICTLNNSLPQGAPTSPCLSNLIAINMDKQISSFCKERKINFTRYSDDLTFSGNKNIGGIIPYIEQILNNNGFRINQDKLRTRRKNESQEVTGIVVNKKLQAPKYTRKKFRQSVYYIKQHGLENHLNHIRNNKGNYLNHLLGVGNFICFVNPFDTKAHQDLAYLKTIYTEQNNV
jgi:RNA-directed DNA polymerase